MPRRQLEGVFSQRNAPSNTIWLRELVHQIEKWRSSGWRLKLWGEWPGWWGGGLFPGSLGHFCRARDAEIRGGEHILPAVLWEGQQRKQPALIHFLARKVRTNQSIFLLFILKFIYFKLKDITLQYCIGFCHTSAWISHSYTHIPFLLNRPPTSHPIPSLHVVTECQISLFFNLISPLEYTHTETKATF